MFLVSTPSKNTNGQVAGNLFYVQIDHLSPIKSCESSRVRQEIQHHEECQNRWLELRVCKIEAVNVLLQ